MPQLVLRTVVMKSTRSLFHTLSCSSSSNFKSLVSCKSRNVIISSYRTLVSWFGFSLVSVCCKFITGVASFYRVTTWNATHGVAVAIFSVCRSICHVWIVTKLNDALQIFWHRMKRQSLCYSDTNSGWWATTPSLWNLHSNWPAPSRNANFVRFLKNIGRKVFPSTWNIGLNWPTPLLCAVASSAKFREQLKTYFFTRAFNVQWLVTFRSQCFIGLM